MDMLNLKVLADSLIYSLIGTVFFVVAFIVVDKATPGSLWHELMHEKNLAVAIVAGAMALGIAIIVAAAIHG